MKSGLRNKIPSFCYCCCMSSCGGGWSPKRGSLASKKNSPGHCRTPCIVARRKCKWRRTGGSSTWRTRGCMSSSSASTGNCLGFWRGLCRSIRSDLKSRIWRRLSQIPMRGSRGKFRKPWIKYVLSFSITSSWRSSLNFGRTLLLSCWLRLLTLLLKGISQKGAIRSKLRPINSLTKLPRCWI